MTTIIYKSFVNEDNLILNLIKIYSFRIHNFPKNY